MAPVIARLLGDEAISPVVHHRNFWFRDCFSRCTLEGHRRWSAPLLRNDKRLLWQGNFATDAKVTGAQSSCINCIFDGSS